MSRTDSLKPIRPPRLHEAVEAYLEEMILAGEYQPGDSLPSEHEMANQLEVSRTVVRDAIRALTTKGLVEIRHGVGTFVTHSGREKLAQALALSLRRGDYSPWELYQVRRGLEMIVVELAVETATQEQITEMRDALMRLRNQSTRGAAPAGLGLAHTFSPTHGALRWEPRVDGPAGPDYGVSRSANSGLHC